MAKSLLPAPATPGPIAWRPRGVLALRRYSVVAAFMAAGFVLSLLVAAAGVQRDHTAHLTQQAEAATTTGIGRIASDLAAVGAALDFLVERLVTTELRFSGVDNGLAAPLAGALRHDLILGGEIRDASGEVIARKGAAAGAFPPFSALFPDQPDLSGKGSGEIIIHRPRPMAGSAGIIAIQRRATDGAGRLVSVVLLVSADALRLAVPQNHGRDVSGRLLATVGGDILVTEGEPFTKIAVTDGTVLAALPQSYRTLLPAEVRSFRARLMDAGPERIFAYGAVGGWPLVVVSASIPRFGWGMVGLVATRALAIAVPVAATLLLFLLAFRARWAGHRRRLAELDRQLLHTRAALRNSDAGVIFWEYGADTVNISDRWKRLLGYRPDEVGDQLEEWMNRIHRHDRPGAIKGLQSVIDGKAKQHRHVIRMLAKDGSIRHVTETISAVRGNNTDVPTLVLTQIALAAPIVSEAKPAAPQDRPSHSPQVA